MTDFFPVAFRRPLGFLRMSRSRVMPQYLGLCTQIRGQHLAAIFEPPARLKLQRALEQRNHVRVQNGAQPGISGQRPQNICHSTSPVANTSDRRDGRPIACSGAMYPTVPAPEAEIVRWAIFEIPKSVSRSKPSGNSSKLSGFTSQ